MCEDLYSRIVLFADFVPFNERKLILKQDLIEKLRQVREGLLKELEDLALPDQIRREMVRMM